MQACRLRWLPKRSLRAPSLSYRSFSTSSHHESSEDTFDLVCVGGGPAGLSLLAGLRASPITSELKVALVESQDLAKAKFNNTSPTTFANRCSSLTPASVDYLQRIGAWQHVDHSRVQPYQEMEVWDGVTGSRISFDWATVASPFASKSPAGGTIAYMIENANLTAALQARLSELGGTTMLSPARVEAITYGPPSTHGLDLSTWPTLRLSSGRTLSTRLLVGADGASSPVRAFAGIASRGWDYNRMGVVATLRLGGAPAHARAAFQRFLPAGPVALLPLPGAAASLVWSTTGARAAALAKLSGEDFAAMVDAAFRLPPPELAWLHGLEAGQAGEVAWRRSVAGGPDGAKMPPEVVAVQQGSVAAFPLRMRHADTYVAPRVALVGDAAHTVHPLAGQGLNLGLADGAALVGAVEDAVEVGRDVSCLLGLEKYNAERYAANNAVLGVCDKLHKLYSWESGPVVAARSLGLSAVDKMGFLKGFLMRSAAGA